MGRERTVKAATRHARTVAKRRALSGDALVTAEAMRELVPPDYANALRYRNVKRIVVRALAIPAKETGTIFVGRRDTRAPSGR